jgi:hypothetical protein
MIGFFRKDNSISTPEMSLAARRGAAAAASKKKKI